MRDGIFSVYAFEGNDPMKRTDANHGRATASMPRKKAEKKTAAEPAVEYDRRGKPLPPRQRVGGIITPQ
jgi:hypothetical protein